MWGYLPNDKTKVDTSRTSRQKPRGDEDKKATGNYKGIRDHTEPVILLPLAGMFKT